MSRPAKLLLRRCVGFAAWGLVLLGQPLMAQSYSPANIAIIDAELERAAFDKMTKGNHSYPPGAWTPTEEQAKAAYGVLAAALRDPNLRTAAFHDSKAQAAVAENLGQYRLQFRGTTVREGADVAINGPPGTKQIHIFGICPEEKVEHWRTGAIIADGGSCFFNVTYDPQRAKVLYFGFNGVA